MVFVMILCPSHPLLLWGLFTEYCVKVFSDAWIRPLITGLSLTRVIAVENSDVRSPTRTFQLSTGARSSTRLGRAELGPQQPID